MDFNCTLRVIEDIHLFINNTSYVFHKGDEFRATGQSIDRKKWFVWIEIINQFVYLDKYLLSFVIQRHITCMRAYGELQLIVLGETKYSFICIAPSGYVTYIHKADAQGPILYTHEQYLNSDDARFI